MLYVYQFLCIYVMLLLQKFVIYIIMIVNPVVLCLCLLFVYVYIILISTRTFHDTECTYMYLEGSQNF
jgi:hypothetical protein